MNVDLDRIIDDELEKQACTKDSGYIWVKGLPESVKCSFKSFCAGRGITMSEMIRRFMVRIISDYNNSQPEISIVTISTTIDLIDKELKERENNEGMKNDRIIKVLKTAKTELKNLEKFEYLIKRK